VLAGLDLDRHAPPYILAEVEMKTGGEHVDRSLRDRYAAVDSCPLTTCCTNAGTTRDSGRS
jgi:hypothetical protein